MFCEVIFCYNFYFNFRGYQQQDAHEFLRYMLDRLHTELLHLLPDSSLKDSPYISLAQKGRSSIVTSVFGGTLQSEVSLNFVGDNFLIPALYYYLNLWTMLMKGILNFNGTS